MYYCCKEVRDTHSTCIPITTSTEKWVTPRTGSDKDLPTKNYKF